MAVNVVKAIEEDLDKVCLPCAGYTLNLSVQNAFEVKAVQKAISRLKKVVEQSSPHREELENKQEMLYIFPQTHITQCHNRLILFNVLTSAAGSTTQVEFSVDMIQRLCEQQAAIYAVVHNHRDLLHLEHSPEEWRLLEDLCNILEPFRDATTYLSADQYPSLSALSPLLAQIRKKPGT